MEEFSRENQQLLQQVRDLQHQLALVNKNHIEYSLAPPPKSSQRSWKQDDTWAIEERKKRLESLDFYPYDFEDYQLLQLAYDMFSNLGLIETFRIPKTKLQNFLMSLRDSYRQVPFHSFYHAFNVAQTTYFFFTTCDVAKKLGPLEQFCQLIAAFCHDIDHPGLNNTFLCNASSSLALLYNDFSVLEQHHCNEAFELLRRPDCHVFINLDPDQYKLARKYIIACILATDLAVHGEFMQRLKGKLESLKWDSFEDKKLIMCCLVKCADISNEIRPCEIGKCWAERVMTEFFAQSALEREKGMPIAPHMDPEQTNTATGQIGFITYLANPLFQEMVKVFPKLQVCCDQMQVNKENWQKVEAKQAQLKKN